MCDIADARELFCYILQANLQPLPGHLCAQIATVRLVRFKMECVEALLQVCVRHAKPAPRAKTALDVLESQLEPAWLVTQAPTRQVLRG